MLFEDRSRAEAFGAVADLYDRVRPSYPTALFDALLGVDGGGCRTVEVLDVGCGTGIAGALLAARGCHVLGVEIDGRMGAVARAKGLTVEETSFERWDDAGRRFDLLVCGQAWHWIDPRLGTDKAAHVLRPGGQIALFWNLGDPSPAARERLAPVYAELEPELENYSMVLGRQAGRDREAVTVLDADDRFQDVRVREFPWQRTYTTDEWLSFLRTHSDHQVLAGPRLERLLAAVGEALDDFGGSFEVEYEAVLVSARRA
jgi:SAM-dependent methyltransferase